MNCHNHNRDEVPPLALFAICAVVILVALAATGMARLLGWL